jgi:hypothetical protein
VDDTARAFAAARSMPCLATPVNGVDEVVTRTRRDRRRIDGGAAKAAASQPKETRARLPNLNRMIADPELHTGAK